MLAYHVTVTDKPDAGASLTALPDKVSMPRPVQDADCHIPAGDSFDKHLYGRDGMARQTPWLQGGSHRKSNRH